MPVLYSRLLKQRKDHIMTVEKIDHIENLIPIENSLYNGSTELSLDDNDFIDIYESSFNYYDNNGYIATEKFSIVSKKINDKIVKGIVILKNKCLLIPIIYKDISIFKDNFFKVYSDDGYCGLYDYKGNIIIEPNKYKNIHNSIELSLVQVLIPSKSTNCKSTIRYFDIIKKCEVNFN